MKVKGYQSSLDDKKERKKSVRINNVRKRR